MIVKVCKRVTNVRGMIGYLMGPGKGQVHTNQHTVAGTIQYPGPDSTSLRRQLTADLELHSKLHPGVEVKNGPVYHVVLSLPPEDGQLSDAKWNTVANEFMDKMGMTGTGAKSTMWTAIRHGVSADGNDHVHILASLIRQDGTKVSLHTDMIRASKIIGELERKHGLRVLTGRGVGGNQQPYTGGEIGRSQRNGTEIERVKLERLVRAAAEVSAGEAEFVRRLRAQGIEVRAYRTGDEVTGYSVKLPGGDLAFGGGKLARDLSLPALRRRWAQGPAHQRSAQHEWIKGVQGQPVTRYGTETRTNMPSSQKVNAELSAMRKAVEQAHTPQHIRDVSRDLSGALAAGSQLDRQLARPARQLSAWAPRYGPQRRFQMAAVTTVLVLAARGNTSAAEVIMVRQVIDALMELYRLHRMRAQAVHGERQPRRGVSMATPESDGMEEALDGVSSTVVVGAATVAQHLAQIGQDKLLMQLSNQADKFDVESAPDASQNTSPVAVLNSSTSVEAMSNRQLGALTQIATRAGLQLEDLKLGDLRFDVSMSKQQAGRMIDALGDPKYGSSGWARHTLVEIRDAVGQTVRSGLGTVTADAYTLPPNQRQGVREPKQTNSRKV